MTWSAGVPSSLEDTPAGRPCGGRCPGLDGTQDMTELLVLRRSCGRRRLGCAARRLVGEIDVLVGSCDGPLYADRVGELSRSSQLGRRWA